MCFFFYLCQASTYAFHMCNLLQVEKSTFFLLLWLLPHSFLIPLPHLPVFLLLVLRLLVRVQLSLPEPFKSCPCIRRNVSPYSSSNLEQTRGVLSSQRRSLFCIIYVKYASLSVNNNHSARLFETSAIDLFHFFLTQAGIKESKIMNFISFQGVSIC